MDHNDYRIHLLTCEFLDREPVLRYKKVHDCLTDMWDGMEIVVNSQNDRIVLQKGGEWFFAQDTKNGILWCQHERVWSFLEKDMGMEYPEIREFIESVMVEHLCSEMGMLYWV